VARLTYCPGCHINCILSEIDPNCITLRRAFDPNAGFKPANKKRRDDGRCYLCLINPAEPGRAVCADCRNKRARARWPARKLARQQYRQARRRQTLTGGT
jgi:hypothetical protein